MALRVKGSVRCSVDWNSKKQDVVEEDACSSKAKFKRIISHLNDRETNREISEKIEKNKVSKSL